MVTPALPVRALATERLATAPPGAVLFGDEALGTPQGRASPRTRYRRWSWCRWSAGPPPERQREGATHRKVVAAEQDRGHLPVRRQGIVGRHLDDVAMAVEPLMPAAV